MINEREQAEEILNSLSRYDTIIYDIAALDFAQHSNSGALGKDANMFEDKYAAVAVKQLIGRNWRGSTVYSVRDQIIGSGFFARDAAGQQNCRIWTGPGERSSLYMPVPANAPVSLKIWVHGYAAEAQRLALKIEVDDQPIQHVFEPADGWREVIVTETYTSKSWTKITIIVTKTVDSVEAGIGLGDDRKRGLSFDQYGWEVLSNHDRSAGSRVLSSTEN
jgi:hypothetical protein